MTPHFARTMLPVVSLLAAAVAAAPAQAEPPIAAEQIKPSTSYHPETLRQIHIEPKAGASGFATLFQTSTGNRARILHDMGEASALTTDDIATAVENFYDQADAKLIWVDGNGLTQKAIAALALLKQADDWGLNAPDYQVQTSYEALPDGSAEKSKALARFEAALSTKVLMFLQDNYRGRIEPNKLSSYYDFKRKKLDLSATLVALSDTANLMQVAQRLMPDNAKFSQLAIELQFLRNSPQSSSRDADIDKVIVAMEELRWLPQEFPDRYVFINQPAYMAYYNENGQLALSMKAVIGQQDHQTNFFDATIKTVEFNPDWGVPQSIIKNEMLPHLRRDPAYLDKEGYVVSVHGKTVRSSEVDWTQPLDDISVVQPPGPDNALGRLKILFPNPHAIYMHDTPARGKFAAQDRMFSHGCVRLQDPQAMAAAVLKTNVDFVNQQIAGGAKKDMPVPEELPVYVAYFTAWPTADGIVHYYDDIYSRDADTLSAIAVTTASRSAS